MEISYDPAKDARNIEKHGLSLAAAEGFEWGTAMVREDTRQPYGEQRFQATGFMGQRLYVLVFTLRGEALRVISLRKANSREVKRYAKT